MGPCHRTIECHEVVFGNEFADVDLAVEEHRV